MNRNDWSAFLCRVLALVLFYQAVTHISERLIQNLYGIWTMLGAQAGVERMFCMLGMIGIPGVLAIMAWFVWTFADPLSRRMIQPAEGDVSAPSAERKHWEQLTILVTGLFILSQVIWDFEKLFGTYRVTEFGETSPLWLVNLSVAWLIAFAVKALLGLYMVLGRQRCVAILRKLRYNVKHSEAT